MLWKAVAVIAQALWELPQISHKKDLAMNDAQTQ